MKGNQNENPAGPASWAKSLTAIGVRLYRALPKSARRWTLRIFRAVFSEKVTIAVALLTLAAMYWHTLTIVDNLEVRKAVGVDCLYALPWGIVWAIRAARMPMPEEGGEA